jgi:hypothetical protein
MTRMHYFIVGNEMGTHRTAISGDHAIFAQR